jgi:hypothetical protein
MIGGSGLGGVLGLGYVAMALGHQARCVDTAFLG